MSAGLRGLETVLRRRQPDLTVVMENIHDPHNVSAMLRSCDAAGVLEAQLLYTIDAFPKIGKKSSCERRQVGGEEEDSNPSATATSSSASNDSSSMRPGLMKSAIAL